MQTNVQRLASPPNAVQCLKIKKPQRLAHNLVRAERLSNVTTVERESAEHATSPGREDTNGAAPQAESIGNGNFGKSRKAQWKRPANLSAQAHQSLHLTEKQRPLAEYMALPASQYSVLDAQRIERIDDSTFCCYVGQLKFFGIRVEPVLTVSVNVGPRGPTVKLLSTVLEGSPVVEAANNRFDATMTNVVTWSAPASENGHDGSSKQLESNAEIQQLKADYELWASGDQSRNPIGDGKL